MSKQTLIDDLKSITFYYPPRKTFNPLALTPLQKNIIISSKSNNAKYLSEAFKRAGKDDFEVVDQHGNTPLYYAVKGQCQDAVEVLLSIGVDVNVKCEFGNTCLHTAMLVKDGSAKNERIINMLLNNGLSKPKTQSCSDFKNATMPKTRRNSLIPKQPMAPFERVAYNTANIRALNNHNETPLFYAS